MRRYLQGTLDFDCAIYALINTLSCTHGIDLVGARRIYQQTILSLSEMPRLWQAFLRNETDQYWVVRHLISRWCVTPPWRLAVGQPFGDCLMPDEKFAMFSDPGNVELFLPELFPATAGSRALQNKERANEAEAVWAALTGWLEETIPPKRQRVAMFRFHRWVPDVSSPLVSHWTTGVRVAGGTLFLHDASGEKNALHSFTGQDLLRSDPLVRIVPESLVLFERRV